MDKIFFFFYILLLFSFVWGYSTEFAINKIQKPSHICYNKFVQEILANKRNIFNQCELITFQLNNADQIKPTSNFLQKKLVEQLWNKYFNPELQFNPNVFPKLPILNLKITPDNLDTSIFNQTQAWNSKENTENVPDCICFNFDNEYYILTKGSKFKNFTVNIPQKNNSSISWDIVKFKEAIQIGARGPNSDYILLRSDGEAKTIALWTAIAASVASILYYLFMISDEVVKYKCKTLF